MKFKGFYTERETVNHANERVYRMRGTLLADRRQVSEIYIEHEDLNIKKTNNQF